jgi:hypothetical protein
LPLLCPRSQFYTFIIPKNNSITQDEASSTLE